MDNKIIQTKIQEFTILETVQLIADKIPEDLTGLYGDIRVELSKKVPDGESMIDAYADIMAKEQQIYSPENAYKSGFEAAQSGQEYNPTEYLSKVYLSFENKHLFNERDNIFHKLCDLLGDTRGLICEYTKLYRLFHGTVNNKIHLFYQWGYYGKIPEFQENTG